MHIVGQRNSLYVIGLIFATLFSSYAMLWLTGTSLQQAQEMNWFFSSKELQDPPFFASTSSVRYQPFICQGTPYTYSCLRSLCLHVRKDATWWSSWTAPAPMGVWVMLAHGDVHWPSFRAGISTMSALAFLYLIRCSLHAAALKKNVPNVTRKTPEAASPTVNQSVRRSSIGTSGKAHREQLSLGKILENGYGYSQLFAALTGGIAVAPAVAASLTLFKVSWHVELCNQIHVDSHHSFSRIAWL